MKEFKLDTTQKIASGFKTPDNYFDTLSEKVMLQIPEKEVKVLSIFQRKKSIIFLVAAVFMIALLLPQLFTSATKTTELDNSSIENYLTYQSNVSQYDIINLLDEEDIDALRQEVAVDGDMVENSSNTN
ncbi:hypothetical protein [Flavobacterium algicola]|uniref:hypothetical protein n=1 Tax=Flavobacterium algicola TaxID=556529 RepID=UPI001EFD39B8|nr:hypothetical protein [Flavobacterium algicola]MCG9793038.1 hypothetical protein [Flavobacterium algicola]